MWGVSEHYEVVSNPFLLWGWFGISQKNLNCNGCQNDSSWHWNKVQISKWWVTSYIYQQVSSATLLNVLDIPTEVPSYMYIYSLHPKEKKMETSYLRTILSLYQTWLQRKFYRLVALEGHILETFTPLCLVSVNFTICSKWGLSICSF